MNLGDLILPDDGLRRVALVWTCSGWVESYALAWLERSAILPASF